MICYKGLPIDPPNPLRSFYGALNVVLMLVTVVSVILRDFIVGSVTVAVPNRGYGAKPQKNEKRRG